MNDYIFSYGTLQKEKVQLELFGRVLKGTSDILRGYRTATIEIKDKSFLSKGEQDQQQTLIISKNKNDKIEGTVYELTEEELLIADKYEPDNYKRVRVVLESGKRAWVYMAIEIS